MAAHVPQLDDHQRDRLFGLAGRQRARHNRRAARKVQPQLRRLLDELTASPAL